LVNVSLWFAACAVIPVLWLPVAARIAGNGFRGFNPHKLVQGLKQITNGKWWAAYLVLFAIGIYAPYKLATWVPGVSGLSWQAVSMVARFVVAYLLKITSWYILAGVLGRYGGSSSSSVDTAEPA
jgi:hypothetical protein